MRWKIELQISWNKPKPNFSPPAPVLSPIPPHLFFFFFFSILWKTHPAFLRAREGFRGLLTTQIKKNLIGALMTERRMTQSSHRAFSKPHFSSRNKKKKGLLTKVQPFPSIFQQHSRSYFPITRQEPARAAGNWGRILGSAARSEKSGGIFFLP